MSSSNLYGSSDDESTHEGVLDDGGPDMFLTLVAIAAFACLDGYGDSSTKRPRTIPTITGSNGLMIHLLVHKSIMTCLECEGSAHNKRVLLDTLVTYKECFLHPPEGKYYLVDSGYPNRKGYLASYKNQRSLGQATTPSITAFAQSQGAAYRMFKTIERQPDIDVCDTTSIILEDIKGDVELKGVYFSCPTRPEHLIFDGFSLRVPRGTTMAQLMILEPSVDVC